MASKKATIYILNVNYSMSMHPDNAFPKALYTITSSIEDRAIIGRKTDLVSVLLCGTPETNNILATPGQYENIECLTDIAIPSVDLIKRLANVAPSNENDKSADVLDALIVAINMISTYCKKLKYAKRVVIFTDNQTKIDWRDLPDVANMLNESSIELLLVGVDHDELISPDCSGIVKENYEHWTKLIKSGFEGDIVSLRDAYAQTQAIYIKEVRASASFKGYLYLGTPHTNENFLAISIQMYLRTKEEKLPSSHKVSALSDGPTNDVISASRYLMEVRDGATSDITEIEVPKENLQKGYKFGKSILIISDEEVGHSKIETKKEMTIVGFLPVDQFPRHYFYSNAYIVSAGDVRKEESAVAIATLSQALFVKNCYALVRYISKDNGQVKMGVLQPELDERAPILQYFDIPFANDIRDYKFRAIDKTKSNQEGLELVEDLVDRMNLDKYGDGYLAPENNYNPTIWKMCKSIKSRALDPNSKIPDLDTRFGPQLKLSDEVKSSVGNIGEEISNHYNVNRVVDKGKKRAYGQIDNSDSQAGEATAMEDILSTANSDAQNFPNMAPPMIQRQEQVVCVGLVTPVEDFRTMLSRTDNDGDVVGEAVSQMSAVILDLLNRSFGNQYYQKAFQCIEALRKTAAKEDEASTYNKTIQEVKVWCNLSDPDTPRRAMWGMIKKANFGLITNEECDDTDTRDVTKEVAEKFWNESGEKKLVAEDTDEDKFDTDDLDDLF